MSCASASGDGLYVAIARDHELSLYTVEPFAEIARTSLEPGTERTVVFVGRQVLVHEPTRIGVYALPRLSVTAKVELGRRTRLHATSSHYALLVRDGEALVVACTSEGAALAPTRTPAHVDRAVGLEVARFLIWPKQGPAEIWDAVTRLPVARIGLELPPDASAVGATAKHRSVWITTRGGE
ncbi:MAG TPA: hypothetical protein VK427_17770, partial [Kofleriaceae bacterium]|nr:hypothetical protein [Kofleriaceae bacterium]